jgi:hypothetical protein
MGCGYNFTRVFEGFNNYLSANSPSVLHPSAVSLPINAISIGRSLLGRIAEPALKQHVRLHADVEG